MYRLTNKVQSILKDDKVIRRKVASVMGVSESAIYMSISDKRGGTGRSIANNYDAINALIDETGLTIADIRVIDEEPVLQ